MTESSITVSKTRVVQTKPIMPNMLNPSGVLFGGEMLYYVDYVAGVCYIRYARQNGVTVTVDNMSFIKPLPAGDVMTIEAFVSGHGERSVEIFIKVTGENFKEQKTYLAASGFLTFVHPEKVELPKLIAETKEEEALLAGYPQRQALKQEMRTLNNHLYSNIELEES